MVGAKVHIIPVDATSFATALPIFFNNSENIEFKHEALSRKVFANGAIEIAKLILNNEPKLYSTEDFFNTK